MPVPSALFTLQFETTEAEIPVEPVVCTTLSTTVPFSFRMPLPPAMKTEQFATMQP